MRRTTGGISTCGATAARSHAGFGLGFERLIMYLTGIAQHP